MKITKKLFLSPSMIFIAYMVVSSLGIVVFRLFFIPEPPPLPIYIGSWRLVQGILDFISFFPALTLSGLVIPFGLYNDFKGGGNRFSSQFLKQIKSFIIIALVAVTFYGLLFFLVFPLVRDYESHLRHNGDLFYSSKAKAQAHAEKGAWNEAARFIAICDQLWPHSPEIASFEQEVVIRFDEWRITQLEAQQEVWVPPNPYQDIIAMYAGLPGQLNPVNAAEAIAMANIAMHEERYYDAHWLATIGIRLAKRGSIERVQGTRIANQAWDAVTSLGPNAKESRIYSLYRQKQEGYEALVSEDWIKAYYIFRELSVETPGDPDVARFFALSETGIKGIAFFTDEMELTLGDVLTEAIFSFPLKTATGNKKGRIVFRASSLSTSQDASYGLGIELMAFNEEGTLLYQAETAYAKIVPIIHDARSQLLIMMCALDRFDQDKRYEPIWTGPYRSEAEDVQMILDLSYEDFLLLSRFRRGIDPLPIGDIFEVAQRIGSYGYIPEFFHAEIISRIAEVANFFPLMILTIILGWRYRAKKRTSAMAIPMLVGFPFVFSGIVFICRKLINFLSIWLVISLGFSLTILLFIIGTVFLFVFVLILLVAQQE
jgi:hypothetical protein